MFHLFWVAGLVEYLLVVNYFMGGHNELRFGVPLVVGDIVPIISLFSKVIIYKFGLLFYRQTIHLITSY